MINLSRLHLENFKCFPDSSIDFGKITLLTGANSSGKSSFMNSFLGVLQSKGFPFSYSTNGSYIDMGDYVEMVLDHDSSKEIVIGFQVQEGSRLFEINLKMSKSDDSSMPKVVGFTCSSDYFSFDIEGDLYGGLFRYSLDYSPSKNPNSLVSNEEKRKYIISKLLKDGSVNKDESDELISYLIELGKELHIHDDQFDIHSQDTAKDGRTKVLLQVIAEVTFALRHLNDHFNYVASYRTPPGRTYLERPTEKKLGPFGDGFVDLLLSWIKTDKDKFDRVIATLRKLEILNDIKIDQMLGGSFNVLIKTAESGPFSSLYDVGFGVSQILPIVIADMELGDQSTLYAAQPELHLHPSVQAEFASYMMQQVASCSKRYIIETHSEYLLNRIRLGIVKGIISEDDVKVYYLQMVNGKSTISPLSFTKNGQILGAPDDFFKTYMMDVMNIAIEAME